MMTMRCKILSTNPFIQSFGGTVPRIYPIIGFFFRLKILLLLLLLLLFFFPSMRMIDAK